jgi:hypothetical protein
MQTDPSDSPDRHDELTRLYHYTTIEGLKGILESEEIWATDVDYLNDGSEYVYAERFIEDVLTDLAQDEFLRELLLGTLPRAWPCPWRHA